MVYAHNNNNNDNRKHNINKLVEFFQCFSKKKRKKRETHRYTSSKGLHQQGWCRFFFGPLSPSNPFKERKKKIVQLHVPHEFHTTNL